MGEFLVNPRRAHRAPARCRAAVVSPTGTFEAETEDISALGCQVVSPRSVSPGDALELHIACDKVAETLRVAGKVCWVSDRSPHRVGVAFDEAFIPSAERWFEKLVAAMPGMGSFRRVPERIPIEAMVYLGPPPRFVVDFTADEASLLRGIASGARIDELQARLRGRWPEMQRALFSLLARQAVTLSRGHAAHPDAWKRILTDVEASLAVESLGTTPLPFKTVRAMAEPEPDDTSFPLRPLAAPLPPPRGQFATNPAASPWGASPQARDPSQPLDLGEPGPPLEVAPKSPPRGAARAQPSKGWGGPSAPAAAGARGPAPAGERLPEAQALYDRALAEMGNGSVNGAMALLRKALTIAPGDPEISEALGKLAYKDRLRG
jgi:PilZ domain